MLAITENETSKCLHVHAVLCILKHYLFTNNLSYFKLNHHQQWRPLHGPIICFHSNNQFKLPCPTQNCMHLLSFQASRISCLHWRGVPLLAYRASFSIDFQYKYMHNDWSKYGLSPNQFELPSMISLLCLLPTAAVIVVNLHNCIHDTTVRMNVCGRPQSRMWFG